MPDVCKVAVYIKDSENVKDVQHLLQKSRNMAQKYNLDIVKTYIDTDDSSTQMSTLLYESKQ